MLNVIITGASKGIGLEIARAFMEVPEIRLGLIARNEKELKEFKSSHNREKTQIHLFPFDLEKTTAIPGLSAEIQKSFPTVDIMINNAGILVNKPFTSLDITEYERIFRINFYAPALLIRNLIFLLQKSSIRHVVNIGGMGGFQGSQRFPGLTIYNASKAALANLTESLAAEFQKEDVRFNCLAPGAVQTEMFATAFPGYTAPVQPAEMGKYIFEFSMQGYRFMNGKIIPLSVSTP